MPTSWIDDGLSPYTMNATTKTMAGAEARIGVAIDIGSVLSAQKVNTHEVPTITHFTAESARISAERPDTAEMLPQSASAPTYAAHPKHVEHSSVGRTELCCTLAFLARS